MNYYICILLNIIKTKFYHFRHCICRRDGCDHGDICQKDSDCGKDQWNRRGKCVSDYIYKNGIVSYKDGKMGGSEYDKKYGPWKNHK